MLSLSALFYSTASSLHPLDLVCIPRTAATVCILAGAFSALYSNSARAHGHRTYGRVEQHAAGRLRGQNGRCTSYAEGRVVGRVPVCDPHVGRVSAPCEKFEGEARREGEPASPERRRNPARPVAFHKSSNAIVSGLFSAAGKKSSRTGYAGVRFALALGTPTADETSAASRGGARKAGTGRTSSTISDEPSVRAKSERTRTVFQFVMNGVAGVGVDDDVLDLLETSGCLGYGR
ncbi:hypothetical protein DFH11DRAFT_1732982 [Phellopilus nigrolimitatus]|nr:hypothetical protein DFH11DRAFT_1732982 [Phellopilus nigrolimitatus]